MIEKAVSAALASGLLLIGMSQTASAQQAIDTGRLQACRALEGKSDRLKCYDGAMDAFFGVDERLVEQRQERLRDSFGKESTDDEDAVKELKAVVAAVDFDPAMGAARIQLDNGQEWRTTSNGTLAGRLRPGQNVTIYQGGLFGYRLRVDDRVGMQGVVRVK